MNVLRNFSIKKDLIVNQLEIVPDPGLVRYSYMTNSGDQAIVLNVSTQLTIDGLGADTVDRNGLWNTVTNRTQLESVDVGDILEIEVFFDITILGLVAPLINLDYSLALDGSLLIPPIRYNVLNIGTVPSNRPGFNYLFTFQVTQDMIDNGIAATALNTASITLGNPSIMIKHFKK
jgi:hypothetical protein